MFGIIVKIGQSGPRDVWKWVNDPATGKPFEAGLDETFDQIVRWFSDDYLYTVWSRDRELPT